jgi:hypothetical protein
MSLYITAQIVGFLGYLFLTSAPYSRNRHNIIKIEILAIILISTQWLLLEQPGLFSLSFMNIALCYCALKATNSPRIEKAMSLFYPISIIVLLSCPGNIAINILCLLGFSALVTSKKSQTMIAFRGFSMLAALIFIASGTLAASSPAVIFNLLFFSIHAYRLWGTKTFTQPAVG